jgi:hypothetical protein
MYIFAYKEPYIPAETPQTKLKYLIITFDELMSIGT